MKTRSMAATIILASCGLPWFSANAQVLWNIDFDTSTDLLGQTYFNSYTPPDSPATVTYETVDTGDPAHQSALMFAADSSLNAYGWHAEWVGMLVRRPVATYDPAHTLLKFDLLVYDLKPIHVQIDYGNDGFPFVARGLELFVNPSLSGSFQTIRLPLTSFAVTDLIGTPPNNPVSFQFGMFGNPAYPATNWPSSTNVFMLDNIQYIVWPTLSIVASNGTVALSWPTNTAGFTLQQNPVFASGGWTPVTNTPAVVNDQNQVTISPAGGQSYYRLVGP